MTARVRLLVAVPGAGVPDDVIEMPREEAAAWIDAGRAELIAVEREVIVETTTVQAPENTARRTRRPRGRP